MFCMVLVTEVERVDFSLFRMSMAAAAAKTVPNSCLLDVCTVSQCVRTVHLLLGIFGLENEGERGRIMV